MVVWLRLAGLSVLTFQARVKCVWSWISVLFCSMHSMPPLMGYVFFLLCLLQVHIDFVDGRKCTCVFAGVRV